MTGKPDLPDRGVVRFADGEPKGKGVGNRVGPPVASNPDASTTPGRRIFPSRHDAIIIVYGEAFEAARYFGVQIDRKKRVEQIMKEGVFIPDREPHECNCDYCGYDD